ncbi:MAG: Transcriptional regulator, IclR family [Burkholderiaceae bacterium]|jgi:DNA-binding IclR family transcriptional regulator|nr:MAG: Transcriptional regulator, IclR family [Burkholderiaceae bacterium]
MKYQPDPSVVPGPNSSSERSLALLALIASEGRALTLAEIGARLDLPKATAHRLCGQLLSGGWLVRDIDERSFSVGPALRRMALDTLNNGVLRGLRHAVLEQLVAQVGETCNFTALDGAKVIYLDRVEAPWPWRLTLDVGAHVPLHCTASGKLFLATLPAAQRDALIDGTEFEAMTPATITSAAALRAECEQIAKRGYSTDREEFIAGLNAAAVPVCDAHGRTRAAIAVHAPSTRLSLDNPLRQLSALQAAARRMAALL